MTVDLEKLGARLREAERKLFVVVDSEMTAVRKEYGVVPFLSVHVERVDVTSICDERRKYELGRISVNLTVQAWEAP